MQLFKDRAQAALQRADSAGLLRQLHTRTGQNHPVQFDAEYVNLSSNDYLGLSQHPDVIAALQQSAAHFGVGSGASHLITGHCSVHSELEGALASWLGRDDAVLFSTGYMANVAVLSSLLTRHDVCVQDKLNHASLIDAVQLSRATHLRYAHADTTHSGKLLRQHAANEQINATTTTSKKASKTAPKIATMLVTDGVFSMDGDMAPLATLAAQCQTHQALLMVDDAHGIGVIGEGGKGSVSHYGLSSNDVPILMGTLGKALGTAGAFVAGPAWLTAHLRQFARPFIYTTAMPPSLAAASLASLACVQSESWRREKLHQLIATFTQHIKPICDAHGLSLLPSDSAIQALIVGDAQQTVLLSNALKQVGFWVNAIRPPTVPKGTSRLRFALSSALCVDDVMRLAKTLEQHLGSPQYSHNMTPTP